MIQRDRGVTMSKGPKRKFTQEYKEEALKLWEASGYKTNEPKEIMSCEHPLRLRTFIESDGSTGSSADRSVEIIAGPQSSRDCVRLKPCQYGLTR